MLHSIMLLTLGVIYVFFMFATPKAPPAIVLEQPVAPEEKIASKPVAEEKLVETTTATEVVETNPVDIEVGKKIYLSTCIKCHNKDPNIKGPIGPEVVDAPLEVMHAKVATGRYPEVLPEGFVPKRKTKQMLKLPQQVKDVPSIHAYVQSVKKSK